MRKNFILFKQKNTSPCKPSRFYGLFRTSFILIILAVSFWQCREDDFTGEVIGECPEVISTSPVNGAVNVVSNKLITATFNVAMNPSTINESTFLVKKGQSMIAGAVTYSGTTATFTPTDLLESNTVYTATIKRESKDLMGNIMKRDTTWQFNTGASPVIILTDPLNGASDVALNKAITAQFSTTMNATSINKGSFIVMQGTTPVAGTVSYLGTTATFTPANAFVSNKVYSATINTQVKDLAGNAMTKDSTWSFSTGTLPLITITNPQNGDVNVDVKTAVTATFSKVMNFLTINDVTFTLKQGTTAVSGMVSYKDMTATFMPTSALLPGVEYTATVTTGAKDLDGNALAAEKKWSFTTLAATAQFTVNVSSNSDLMGSASGGGSYNPGHSVTVTANAKTGYTFDKWTENGSQVSILTSYAFTINSNRILVANFKASDPVADGIDLGSAGDFAVLAGSGISNVGVSTLITGDVGSFPTATINGLLSGNVIGTLYTVASPVVGTAKTDLTTAFNDAQGRSTNAISLPGQLGGLTLAPGLYVNSTTSGISGTGANGILTLDAGGNSNAMWIFKMGSTLITDAGTSIVLKGGAQAKNIYWSVGTSATLGTNSIFFGNILADQSITLTTGANLTGRALTRIGAVTLDSNIVTKP